MKIQTSLNTGFVLTLGALIILAIRQQQQLSGLRALVENTGSSSSSHGRPGVAVLSPDSSTPPEEEKGKPGSFASDGTVSGSAEDSSGIAPGHARPTRQEFQKMVEDLQNLQQLVNPQSVRRAGLAARTRLSGESAAVPVTDSMTLSELLPESSYSYNGRPGVPSWNHGQAVGPPDTKGGGDLPTAWAPRSPQSGEQWLQVGYENAREIASINVMETHNPGAISRVTAILPDGSEREIWQGTSPGGESPVETTVPVPPGITSDQIRVYVDTNRVKSWPEIDAVEMVGTDGSRQWASTSKASSSYQGD